MPYKPFKRDSEWCVYKVDANGNPTGDRLGCHTTLSSAMQQVRALYATEDKAYQWSQATAEYTTSVTGEQKCSGCMYFQSNNEQPATCLVVEDKPEPIEPGGWCKFWIPIEMADKQYSGQAPEYAVAIFKGEDGLRYMLLITSNSYEDREGETITTKALQDYVDGSWSGDEFTGTNKLYYEHKGLPIGNIVWCAMEGPFLLECAKERPGAYARKRWDVIEADPDGWGASHGFHFRRTQRVNGTYYKIYKFETTVLKLEKAANLLTFAGVIE